MNEKSSRRFWVCMVLGFFSIDIVIATVAITMAIQDPSFRPIPGFSQRSVNWGERQEQQENLARLGWTIEVDPDHTSPSQIALKVLDPSKQVVQNAALSATIFHYTRVAEQQSAQLVEQDGLYIGRFDLSKPGYWNIDIEGADAAQDAVWKQMRWEQPKPL